MELISKGRHIEKYVQIYIVKLELVIVVLFVLIHLRYVVEHLYAQSINEKMWVGNVHN